MGRVAVFIDGGYFSKVLEQFDRPTIDFMKLSSAVAGQDERLRTYYYHCAPFVSSMPTPDERSRKAKFDSFVAALERLPRFMVRLGRLAKRDRDGKVEYEQKMVDILLAIDLVRLSVSHQIQRAVIFSNDTDFVPAICIAKEEGTVVDLYYHTLAQLHNDLIRACDTTTRIDKSFIDMIRRT